MNAKKAKAARRAQREEKGDGMFITLLQRMPNETSAEFRKRCYPSIVAQAVADGEPLDQDCVDVAEGDARGLFPTADLNLGHKPPRDPRVISLLIDVLADPLWDRLPKGATACDYWEAQEREAMCVG